MTSGLLKLICILLLLSATGLFPENNTCLAQSRKKKKRTTVVTPKIRSTKKELDKIRKSIRALEKDLSKKKAKEHSTLKKIDTYQRQTALLRALISELNTQAHNYERNIQIARLNLKVARNQLKTLQENYAAYVRAAYMRGRLTDAELILSSTSLNQMFIRSKYLKSFTELQRREARRIKEKQEQIEEQKRALEEGLAEQKRLIREKERESQRLAEKTRKHKSLLQEVRQDKTKLLKRLRQRQAAARKLQRIINDLVAKELARRKKAAAKRGIHELPTTPISKTAFGRLKGNLPWPVSRGTVSEEFGKRVHPTLGTITINKGITITVPENSPVHAVADGKVSTSTFIAGFGNLLIIDHGEGFYTVYAHLNQVYVKENQKVKAGQRIARSGETVEGPALHFEIWREREVMNPRSWLRK